MPGPADPRWRRCRRPATRARSTGTAGRTARSSSTATSPATPRSHSRRPRSSRRGARAIAGRAIMRRLPCRCCRARGAASRPRSAGTWRPRLVRRHVQRPQRAERVDAPGRRRRQRREAAAPVDEHVAADDLAAGRLDRGQHRQERAAGREDVVDEEDPLAGLDPEAAPELAPLRAVVGPDLFGEDPPDAELAGRLEGEDHPAGRGAGDEVDRRRRRRRRGSRRPVAAQLARRGRILEDEELLDVALRVAAALELEVALGQGAGRPEQRLGAGRDRAPGGRSRAGLIGRHAPSLVARHPRSRPVLDALRRWRARLARQRRPDERRYESRPPERHSRPAPRRGGPAAWGRRRSRCRPGRRPRRPPGSPARRRAR